MLGDPAFLTRFCDVFTQRSRCQPRVALPFTIAGARHPAASGSASTQNHRSPSDTVAFGSAAPLRHGVIVALDRASLRRFLCDDRPSIGFARRTAGTCSTGSLRQHAPDDARREFAARGSGFEQPRILRQRPRTLPMPLTPTPQADANPIGPGPPIACRDHRRCRGCGASVRTQPALRDCRPPCQRFSRRDSHSGCQS